jgi:hypothetical protein
MSAAGELSQLIKDTDFFTSLRESGLAYPIIMSLHLTSIAIFGGLILMTDLRLLGMGMRSVTISDMVKQTRPWKWVGFFIMVTCGVLLAGAKLDTYYDNPYFQIKLALLACVAVHAKVFRRSVYANPEQLDGAPVIPGVAKAAACLSLVLWIGIMSMGRWIAYFERPGQFGHAPASVSQPAPPK